MSGCQVARVRQAAGFAFDLEPVGLPRSQTGTMKSTAALSLLCIVVLTGCDDANSKPKAVPKPPATAAVALEPAQRLPIGTSAKVTLSVHCGLQYVSLDGSGWVSDFRYDKASRGPGPGMVLKPDVKENIQAVVTRPDENRIVLVVDQEYLQQGGGLGAPPKVLRVNLRPAMRGIPGCA